MKGFFGYIRVSTVKQGERGSSLQEQRAAIEAFARRYGLHMVQWFEERETAAKRGRREFGKMFSALRAGKADGVIIHKIDRGARNLRDWADLGELIDRGIKVHFANESLDMTSRGGRLAADIQAVVAADYIRNLREEVRKGFYGRLKQGLYPLPAPFGYSDRGRGMAKVPDPRTAPFVRLAYELYATGEHTIDTLLSEFQRRGMRLVRRGPTSRDGIAGILRNTFYIGLIRIEKTGQTFQGIHEPLIPKALFDRVAAIRAGRVPNRAKRHQFLFQRLIRCGVCGHSLTGERQKGYVYYRCHTRTCPRICLREEAIDRQVADVLSHLQFTESECKELAELLAEFRSEWATKRTDELKAAELQLSQIDDRIARLTDALLESLIDRDTFERRNASLLLDRRSLAEMAETLSAQADQIPQQLEKFFEQAKTASLSYETGLDDEKRQLVRSTTSNLSATSENVVVELKNPYSAIVERQKKSCGGPQRERVQTELKMLLNDAIPEICKPWEIPLECERSGSVNLAHRDRADPTDDLRQAA